MKYVFGPVNSRRLGVSLGIDIISSVSGHRLSGPKSCSSLADDDDDEVVEEVSAEEDVVDERMFGILDDDDEGCEDILPADWECCGRALW